MKLKRLCCRVARVLAVAGVYLLPALASAATVVLYGASGRVGGLIANEALERGHRVIGISRNPDGLAQNHANFSALAGDVTNLDSMLDIVDGVDVVIISVGGVGPGNTPEEAVAYQAATTFVQAAGELGTASPRVIQVSGGSTLRTNGVWGLDNPEFGPGTRLHGLVFGHWFALEAYRASIGVIWTVMTPPPGAMAPGERTGVYRLGGEEVLFNAAGESNITTQDFAVAVIDEVENAQALGRRVSVGPSN